MLICKREIFIKLSMEPVLKELMNWQEWCNEFF